MPQRWYSGEKPIPDPDALPAWRIVELPHGAMPYLDLEKASIGRIYARAWYNLIKERGPKFGWVKFATELNMLKATGPTKKGSLGNAKSSILFGHVKRGTLPNDPVVRQKLFDLAGYPWD